ncbi:MAG: DNA polymerase III subunit beta [Clostridiales Family XIII bacterium]|nr:DNA polymerase III subunit beta [Clostridiales Family XIII bacterium]
MKIICKKSNLVKALGIVTKAVSPVSTLGITKGVLIKTEGDLKISLSATDIQLAITTGVSAIVNEEGAVVVDARMFSDFIRNLPEEDVVLMTDEKNILSIRTETTDNEIQGIEESEFPRIEGAEEGKKIKVEKAALREMIEGVCFAASTDESRGVITGVLFELEEGNMALVALDGYRVAIRRDYREELKEEKLTAVIPAKMLREAGKILADAGTEEAEATLEIGENRAVLETEDTVVRMNLLNGDYIKYKEVLPKEFSVKFVARREELLNAVELAGILKAEDGKSSFVRFSITDDSLIVSSRSNAGRGKETVAIDKEGEDLEIGFDARFLKEALRAAGEESVVLEFGTSISPAVMRALEGDAFTYLILPVRLSTVNI